jgi:YkoY family integral membrane protein
MLEQFLKSSDFGIHSLLLLPVLVALEAVLSADNAIALAALARGMRDEQMQRQALNLGLVVAFVFRMALILAATWVIKFWQFELLGAAYLLWLVFQYFTSDEESADHHHHGPRFTSLWQAIPMIALTDLAFSLDSVTTAIAISQETWLVLTGGAIGILTLRLMAGLFIRWLKEFTHLEDAGYVTVALVGIRLLLRVVQPDFVPPEWVMISLIAILFLWGFSKRNEATENLESLVLPSTIVPSTSDVLTKKIEEEKQEVSVD